MEQLLPVPGSGLCHCLHSGSSFDTWVLSYSYRYRLHSVIQTKMYAVILLLFPNGKKLPAAKIINCYC